MAVNLKGSSIIIEPFNNLYPNNLISTALALYFPVSSSFENSIKDFSRDIAFCFKSVVKYILNLKEKKEFKMSTLDTGSFMHEVIEEFFDYINDKGTIQYPLQLVDEIEKHLNSGHDKTKYLYLIDFDFFEQKGSDLFKKALKYNTKKIKEERIWQMARAVGRG